VAMIIDIESMCGIGLSGMEIEMETATSWNGFRYEQRDNGRAREKYR